MLPQCIIETVQCTFSYKELAEQPSEIGIIRFVCKSKGTAELEVGNKLRREVLAQHLERQANSKHSQHVIVQTARRASSYCYSCISATHTLQHICCTWPLVHLLVRPLQAQTVIHGHHLSSSLVNKIPTVQLYWSKTLSRRTLYYNA